MSDRYATIMKLFDIGSDYKYHYKIKISLTDINSIAMIRGYKFFKKRHIFYRPLRLDSVYGIKYNHTIIGEQAIDLQFLQYLPKGKYKLVFYLSLIPDLWVRLRVKFKLPYDGMLDDYPLFERS